MPLEVFLSQIVASFSRVSMSSSVRDEARKRILDTLGCFYGGYALPPVATLRHAQTGEGSGRFSVWGTEKTAPAENAAWVNGTAVRALDFNDTYLSKEPCHPSDLLASLWAACEASGATDQGRRLIHGLILGYEIMGRLCDAASLRTRGWDHVTYLPIASAVACAWVLDLSEEQTRHAIALAVTGHVALRQTRVGEISDWKAACAAYAARSGLWAAILAKRKFTGPSDVFSGRHGFMRQVSGRFKFSMRPLVDPWIMMKSHIKHYPAEHHAQSAIEAAVDLHPRVMEKRIDAVLIDTFDVSAAIIGSEPEKWKPTTRETADHSLPYLVAAALLDGHVTLIQYAKHRFLDADIRRLLARTKVRRSSAYSRAYPRELPNKVTVRLEGGETLSKEIRRPLGYAGRPMSRADVEEKYQTLSAPVLGSDRARHLADAIHNLETLERLETLAPLMRENA